MLTVVYSPQGKLTMVVAVAIGSFPLAVFARTRSLSFDHCIPCAAVGHKMMQVVDLQTPLSR